MTIETILLKASDWVPNNPALPVLVYRQAIAGAADPATAFELRFEENGWGGCWRNGVFAYQHYHTRAHEVLGIAGGNVRLLIGGPGGRIVDVSTGDCIVLPAGTGHCQMEASKEFLVVGAYPPHQHADIRTQAATGSDLDTIRRVPLPHCDPIAGRDGPLRAAWGI